VTTATSVAREGEEGVPAELQERIALGVELYHEHGHNVVWVDEDRCEVPSKSRPGKVRLVVFGKEGERCSCPDFKKHGQNLGACNHTIQALMSWAKKTSYKVVKRHDSRIGEEVYDLVEHRGGADRTVGTFSWVGTAYHAKWALESGSEAA
jgi:hypothetical protein